jgi:hypothetical protein
MSEEFKWDDYPTESNEKINEWQIKILKNIIVEEHPHQFFSDTQSIRRMAHIRTNRK